MNNQLIIAVLVVDHFSSLIILRLIFFPCFHGVLKVVFSFYFSQDHNSKKEKSYFSTRNEMSPQRQRDYNGAIKRNANHTAAFTSNPLALDSRRQEGAFCPTQETV